MAVRARVWLPMLVACAALHAVASMSAVAQDAAWPQAVAQLAREKTLAEACASVLKTFADGSPMDRVQGERLYARAAADMDGLVRLLIVDLAGERSPADMPELRQRLEAVPKQRQVLCLHVEAAARTALRHRPDPTGAAELLAQGNNEAPGVTIDAAVRIWRAYRAADPVGQASILARIEATRWLPYADVPAA